MENRKNNLLTYFISWILTVAISASLSAPTIARQKAENRSATPQRTTLWQVSPSFKFDLLCFINVMTGDPFYLRRYQKEYDYFAPKLTPETKAALASLKRKLKDENGNIVSAFLCLHFSATDDETISDMLRTINKTSLMKSNLKKTIYFNETGWRLFESVRDELKVILVSFEELGFADYWKSNLLPAIQKRGLSLQADLTRFNVIAEVETRLGFQLPSNKITIYLLHFAWPHGIRITGTRFVADVSYPFAVIAQNAVHEMLHPPYRLRDDRRLREALDTLRSDSFLMDKISNHNRSFGYNSFESFVEEDCVRALEQISTEKLGIARGARQRWKDEDDGMHVLAVVLYSLMKKANYESSTQPFNEFIAQAIASGDLKPGGIRSIYDSFYQN